MWWSLVLTNKVIFPSGQNLRPITKLCVQSCQRCGFKVKHLSWSSNSDYPIKPLGLFPDLCIPDSQTHDACDISVDNIWLSTIQTELGLEQTGPSSRTPTLFYRVFQMGLSSVLKTFGVCENSVIKDWTETPRDILYLSYCQHTWDYFSVFSTSFQLQAHLFEVKA